MTDPLSITATIVSIAAVSVKVMALIEGFIRSCRNAPSEILKLASGMQSIGMVLGRLAEFSRSPGLDVLLPQQLIEDLRPILGSCMLLIERTERIVGKLNKGMLAGSVLAKLRWVAKEKELEKLRIGMSEHKLTLNMTLAVASCLATHYVHATTTRIEAHNEEILNKLNQLLSQEREELANVSGSSTASSLVIRRFLDDITSYAGSVCSSSCRSKDIMRNYENEIPYPESTGTCLRTSIDQHTADGALDGGMAEKPVELSYIAGKAGNVESWERIRERTMNIACDSASNSPQRHFHPGLDAKASVRFPQRKPVSPSSPALLASAISVPPSRGRNLEYDEPGRRLRLSSKSDDSAAYKADDTPTSTERSSFDEEREVLERLLLADPQHLNWLRVMLDKSNESVPKEEVKAVEPVCGAMEDNSNKILRIHELKVPIIKIPVPLRELEAREVGEAVPVGHWHNKAPPTKFPTPRRRAAGSTITNEVPQRKFADKTIPTTVPSIFPDNPTRTQTQQQEVTIINLSPTESWRLPKGWEFGGSCSPSKSA